MEGNKEDVSDLIVQGGSEGAHDQGSRISAITVVLSCDPSPGSFPKLPALVVSELRYQWARLGCQPKMLNIELSPLAVSPRALLREGQVTVTRTEPVHRDWGLGTYSRRQPQGQGQAGQSAVDMASASTSQSLKSLKAPAYYMWSANLSPRKCRDTLMPQVFFH